MRLTACERIIMDIIWAADHDLTIREIIEILSAGGRCWSKKAVASFLRRLRTKEFVFRYRKGGATLYRPLKSKDSPTGES
ncbi:BlaI/MecI/CopY family transcriptional regulator [Hominifimenecus sp. rT4P-3]|uniref:BlaI/MecI/CopY family transcriptional regulator n=1 Tax=Hominifimenecus sp. rT4P-3 TaxID=3242979 RepID=UPI003DA4228C